MHYFLYYSTNLLYYFWVNVIFIEICFTLFDMKTFRRYFKFSDDKLDNSLSVVIHTLGYHIHPANTSYPDAGHPESHYFDWEKGRRLKEYQILYICKGEGIFEATGMPPQLIEAGTVILL